MLGMSCLRFATMGDATLQDVPFNFQTFYYHWWCYAPKSSLQFSNIMDATFQDLVWNVQKNPTLLVLRFRFSSQFSDIIGASLYTIFFLAFNSSLMLRSNAVSSIFGQCVPSSSLMIRSEIMFLDVLLCNH